MAPRPVIPKDLSKFPDFPKQHELSHEDYEKLIISYWATKKKIKRKLFQENFELEKRCINLVEKLAKAVLQLQEFRKLNGLQPINLHDLTQ